MSIYLLLSFLVLLPQFLYGLYTKNLLMVLLSLCSSSLFILDGRSNQNIPLLYILRFVFSVSVFWGGFLFLIILSDNVELTFLVSESLDSAYLAERLYLYLQLFFVFWLLITPLERKIFFPVITRLRIRIKSNNYFVPSNFLTLSLLPIKFLYMLSIASLGVMMGSDSVSLPFGLSAIIYRSSGIFGLFLLVCIAQRKNTDYFFYLSCFAYFLGTVVSLFIGSKSAMAVIAVQGISLYITRTNKFEILKYKVSSKMVGLATLGMLLVIFNFILGLNIRSGSSLDFNLFSTAYASFKSTYITFLSAVTFRMTGFLSYLNSLRYSLNADGPQSFIQFALTGFKPVWFTQNVYEVFLPNDFRAPGFLGIYILFNYPFGIFLAPFCISLFYWICLRICLSLPRILPGLSSYLNYFLFTNFLDGYFPYQNMVTELITIFLVNSILCASPLILKKYTPQY